LSVKESSRAGRGEPLDGINIPISAAGLPPPGLLAAILVIAANPWYALNRVARTLKYLPLTFAAGPWGFVLFVPYLLGLLVMATVIRQFRAAPPGQ